MSSCERLLTRVFFLFFYEQFDNHCFCLFVSLSRKYGFTLSLLQSFQTKVNKTLQCLDTLMTVGGRTKAVVVVGFGNIGLRYPKKIFIPVCDLSVQGVCFKR